MRTLNKKFFSFLIIISIFSQFNYTFAADSKTPEPYKDEEFPGFLHDFRRAEIITLGAMPFVTFNASLAYSLGKCAFHGFNTDYFVNPFAKSTDSGFSTDEQVGIILTSLGISLCVGITDFIVHSVKRANARKKARHQNYGPVQINPIENDEEAVKIETDEEHDELMINSADEFLNEKKEGKPLKVGN